VAVPSSGPRTDRYLSAATIVALDVKPEVRDLASDLGADHTLDPSSDDVPAGLDALTDDRGVPQVLDFVGGDETLSLAPDVVGGGDHHVVGYRGHVHEPA
jgi:threonine dehydrogenase-like Zn-dependent dehydrogenase